MKDEKLNEIEEFGEPVNASGEDETVSGDTKVMKPVKSTKVSGDTVIMKSVKSEKESPGKEKPKIKRNADDPSLLRNTSVEADNVKPKKKGKAALAVALLVVVAIGVIGAGIYGFTSSSRYLTAGGAVSAAEKLVNESNDLQGAVGILDKNMKKDKDGSMKTLREQYFYWLSENKQKEAYTYIRNYDYIGAAQVLEPILPLNENNSEPTLTKLYDTCINFINAIEWTGDVEHIFFHSLIYDPAATFIGDYQTQGYADNCVTVTEFRRILDRLYENNYILYDIKQLYSVNEDGTVSKRSVYVPEGKKPLVMSFDDACYYDYMKPYGFVQGVDIGPDGMPRTFKRNGDGSKEYIEDGDYQPILEKFVKEHPDFSYGGAKGIIALTGYEGVLGYRTNELDAPDYDQRVQEARAVADGLKALGWRFASHSYGHRSLSERDNVWFGIDTARWEAEVAPIIGGTDIYIYPFGEAPQNWDDPKQTDFIAHGFKMFCGVYKDPRLSYYDNFVFMERRNIDGISFADGRLDTLMDMSGIAETEVRPR